MTDLRERNSSDIASDDPLAHLHKMSTTAGLGSTDYVAINPVAVAASLLGLASALVLLDLLLGVIPLLAIGCAVVSLIQISRSGGTQTGRKWAVLGILLAIAFSSVVV